MQLIHLAPVLHPLLIEARRSGAERISGGGRTLIETEVSLLQLFNTTRMVPGTPSTGVAIAMDAGAWPTQPANTQAVNRRGERGREDLPLPLQYDPVVHVEVAPLRETVVTYQATYTLAGPLMI